MKAKPLKLVYGEGYFLCEVSEATHVELNMPGPIPTRHIPVILKGNRAGTHCWSWNGDVENPTLKPSILTRTGADFEVICHSWVNDGKVQFLGDCSHELAGQTLELLNVD
jgi:hypothetical protein